MKSKVALIPTPTSVLAFRLIVVDENGVLEGIVSLSDLLPYFLDDAYENHTEQKPSEVLQ